MLVSNMEMGQTECSDSKKACCYKEKKMLCIANKLISTAINLKRSQKMRKQYNFYTCKLSVCIYI